MVADAASLRTLVTTKRGQILPEEVGFPRRAPGARGRPSIGLTQEQVDELTHRSPGTCKRLEGGRLRNPADDYLEQLAHLLRFTEQEWQALWLFLFAHQPPRMLCPTAGHRVHGGWSKVLRNLNMPGYITDQGWNVIAQNEQYVQIFRNRTAPANTMRWMLLSEDGRRFLQDWDTAWAPLVIPQLRAAVAAFPLNTTLQELDRDVRRDPVTGRMYTDSKEAYLNPDGDVRRIFYHGLGRVVWVQINTAEPGGAPGTRLMILNLQTALSLRCPRPSPSDRSSGAQIHGPAGIGPTMPVSSLPHYECSNHFHQFAVAL
ncbi:helix-turn-helix domain-containing protein [Kitasatospora cinereorecta]|uniref:Helix-turn-helix domain-containing protein n=1 Tax=Kitasatospora cinereorecta TaxID=285560 RepID=A0ABW0VR74_9ACTN